MQAWIARQGGPWKDVLHLESSLPIPTPHTANHVLIQVAYCDVNPVDLQKVAAIRSELVPGYSGSGIVVVNDNDDDIVASQTRVCFLALGRSNQSVGMLCRVLCGASGMYLPCSRLSLTAISCHSSTCWTHSLRSPFQSWFGTTYPSAVVDCFIAVATTTASHCRGRWRGGKLGNLAGQSMAWRLDRDCGDGIVQGIATLVSSTRRHTGHSTRRHCSNPGWRRTRRKC